RQVCKREEPPREDDQQGREQRAQPRRPPDDAQALEGGGEHGWPLARWHERVAVAEREAKDDRGQGDGIDREHEREPVAVDEWSADERADERTERSGAVDDAERESKPGRWGGLVQRRHHQAAVAEIERVEGAA